MPLPWSLGVSSLGLPGASLRDFLTLARRHGCTAVELRVSDGESVHLAMDDAERRDVRTQCDEAGVAVLALGSYVKVCGDEPVEPALEEHLRLAADVGAPAVRVFPGGDGSPEATARAVERLAAAAPLATDLGVRLLLETHDTHPRGADVARLLSAPELTGAPVGAIWDIAHPWVAGEEPAETWRSLAPYLSHVQVKDVAARERGATPALVGDGVLPLADLARVLAEGGYDGPLVLEWEKPWHPSIPDLEDGLRSAAGWLESLSLPG